MNDASAAPAAPAIEVRFGQVSLLRVRLLTVDPDAIHREFAARIASAPKFFGRTPVGLDLNSLAEEPDVAEVRAAPAAVRRAGVLPIGLAHGSAWVDALAHVLELPVALPAKAAQNQL